ncbi:bifunctional adenosylcobinamide kinase/adenosylcobinamide-phosphate guanylyltransferase [Cellvibrio mixtus]|uniref:Bifunctional adenosylcobalamin biosynthesis protein n=1 Tax=Cellvibrio mixtus TaxID=39650 RepID=A0A266Q336_9GAMM|nr:MULTISPECIES: bifunctional adenosylcobinamide kinase/adenosylcobinamide-phosphate guanylyltransferase [Cellvibrio]AQT58782.1 bifunctional adenosylcobinamide kinase/adenosylcobinamide-phosphate guanylyltransferase [Cellvibrio sp. PSBB023]OZY84260.1 bifunctional adenosylcobinamide kinase/adenosylcobinamide-phosphate guanylyltransferase [Cellvibrio mixtus]
MISLVLGGARSGKSRFAEQLATHSQLPVLYIATATALDDEMAARITHHQTQRPLEWQTCECPLQLVETLARESQKPQCILVDCLTLWLNNQLFHYPQQNFAQLFDQLINSLEQTQATIIFVANEVGLGIIPLGEVSRTFVDEAGRLNQRLAQRADQVFFIAAGLPLTLKGPAV